MGQSRVIRCGLLVLSIAGLPVSGLAQSVPTYNPIYGEGLSARDFADKLPAKAAARKRKADPYSITGYDDGVFSLKPSLEIGAVATDNALFSAAGRQADVGYVLRPSLSFATAWPVHQWTGSISGNWTSFATTSANDGLAGTAQTDFRLDIRRGLTANFSASAVVNESIAGQNQVAGNAVAARRDWTSGASASITKDFGPLQATTKLGISRASFGDVPLSTGVVISNAALNYVEPSFGLRGSLGSVGRPVKPYFGLDYVPRFHDLNGGQRDSHGVNASLGLTLDDGPIWQGDIAAVAMGRVYAGSNLGLAFNGGVNGSLTWSPTRLWSITANSSVALNESSLAGIAALPSWVLGINATYSIRDNLFLHAGSTTTLASNGSGLDQTVTGSLGADYMLTPHFGVTGSVQSSWINSSNSSSRDEQRALIGVLLKP